MRLLVRCSYLGAVWRPMSNAARRVFAMPCVSQRRLLLLIGGVLAAAVAAWLAKQTQTPQTRMSAEPVAIIRQATSPYKHVASSAKYVGAAKCQQCHQEQAASYRKMGHSRALSQVDPQREPVPGSFTHESGVEHQVYEAEGVVRHRQFVRDGNGDELVSADYAVSYLIGSGRHTRSYLVEDDGFLLQSPLTWYASNQRWNLSPGYDDHVTLGFGRAVGTDCLTCHAGQMNATSQQFRGLQFTEHAIGCERCHGPGSLHVSRHQQFSGAQSDQKQDLTIVNPATLSRPLLESICADCHLQGAASARVRGSQHNDFRPGLPLGHFRVEFQTQDARQRMTVVGHFEQMRQSRCYLSSDTLTCTTCHGMHEEPPVDKVAHFKKKCMQCHEPQDCGMPMTQRAARTKEDNCIECHMPSSDTEIPHVAFTHHRIAVHGESAPPIKQPPVRLQPMEDLSHLSEPDQDRCLGLAYLQWSETNMSESQRARDQAHVLLASAHDRGIQDGETLSALATLFYGRNNDAAEQLAKRAIQSSDIGAKARARALFVLADLYFSSDRPDDAATLLKEAVGLRRVYEDWLLLGMSHFATGRMDQAIRAWQQAQHIDPYRPDAHQLLAEAYARRSQTGAEAESDKARAQRHRALRESLSKLQQSISQ